MTDAERHKGPYPHGGAQAAERARNRQLKINVAIAVGLVVLYVAVTWVVAHWGGVK